MNKFIKYRREFHQYPETGWRELRTSARIAEILEKKGYACLMGDEVINTEFIGSEKPDEETVKINKKRAVEQGADPGYVEKTGGFSGVIAELDTGRDGPVTALRFDIDALPYNEEGTKGYRPFEEGFISCNENCVHACGHDAHTAIGLGLAESLLKNKEKLKGKVRMIFQPAEELYNGAYSVVKNGHLDDCNNFIAVHMALTAEGKPLPSNTLCCGCKDFLSDAQVDVTFHGRAAHPCGASQEGKNALLAAASAALNLHCIAPHEQGLCRVNVGLLKAGIAANTIAPKSFMSIEYRGETGEIEEYLEKRVFEILDGAAKSYGMEYTYKDVGKMPSGASDDQMIHIIKRAAEKVTWFKKIYFEGNVGGSDDASVMMNKVQENNGIASYVGIGTDTTQPLHNPEFDLDEEAIPATIELLVYAIYELNGN